LTLPSEGLTSEEQMAQQLVLRHPEIQRFAFHPATRQPLRCEVVSIGRPLPADQHIYQLSGSLNDLWRVDLFNHFFNQTLRVIVDVRNRQILVMDGVKVVQPVLGDHLIALVHDLAVSQPAFLQVLEQMGLDATGGVYQDSRCERSLHLAGAWTWSDHEHQLSALVDLTDQQLLGWTLLPSTGKEQPSMVTERSLENTYVMENFCRLTDTFLIADWVIPATLTGSDGLEIHQVTWKGQPVIHSAKLMDWHVSYESGDVVGYTDAMGCPQFSSAAVVAFHGPRLDTIWSEQEVVGFRLIQDFRSAVWPYACNYYYQNQFDFYLDGRFRIAGVNHGLGCGGNAWYRPVFRIDLATGVPDEPQTMDTWDGRGWQALHSEAWSLQSDQTRYSPEGAQYRILGQNRGSLMVPNRGQFQDGSRGDRAYTYVVARRPGEGEEDLATLGQCCRSDEQQGPEIFMETPEELKNQHLIIWYVPQMRNDNRPGSEYCWARTEVQNGLPFYRSWPGTVGPLFIPIESHPQ